MDAFNYLVLMQCVFLRTFYEHGFTLIPARMSNHMAFKMWDEITYPFTYLIRDGITIHRWN